LRPSPPRSPSGSREAISGLSDRLLAGQRDAREEQRTALESVTTKIGQLTENNEKRLEALRETVAGGLKALRTDNADKLEKMRATVEEKLQGTLEKRLGESFQLVSDRLKQVHKGLGEMQNLATGVGDLKRVLSNELEDMLTKDQFATNVRVQPDSGEIVEYAVRLPGRAGDDVSLWLPIDAKFPHEDYDRLLIAQEGGGVDEVEKAALALERAIRLQAKTICEKYVHPPHSTDFAIMFGFVWEERSYPSLSAIARAATGRIGPVLASSELSVVADRRYRCAVYTRKSTEDGLDQEFNSLDAQYEACAAYALSQRHEGWVLVPDRYDDGGFSGGNMERPGLKRLLADVAAGRIDIILLIDRLRACPTSLGSSRFWKKPVPRSCRPPNRSTPRPAWGG
jgi:hypothetical protein